jgi:hypothetical protein
LTDDLDQQHKNLAYLVDEQSRNNFEAFVKRWGEKIEQLELERVELLDQMSVRHDLQLIKLKDYL